MSFEGCECLELTQRPWQTEDCASERMLKSADIWCPERILLSFQRYVSIFVQINDNADDDDDDDEIMFVGLIPANRLAGCKTL